MERQLSIVIDGPAGAGKSTVARLLAGELGYRYLDTGATYRAVALVAKNEGINMTMRDRLADLCSRVQIAFVADEQGQTVYVDGEDVTEAIRDPEVGMLASSISQEEVVRNALVGLQRTLGGPGTVAEGRDMGTVVFPDADLKFYLDADLHVRGTRRYKEFVKKGIAADVVEVVDETESRDRNDSQRELSPLRQAADAIYVDSTNMTPDEVVGAMLAEVDKKM
jgi:cytidylate kinase